MLKCRPPLDCVSALHDSFFRLGGDFSEMPTKLQKHSNEEDLSSALDWVSKQLISKVHGYAVDKFKMFASLDSEQVFKQRNLICSQFNIDKRKDNRDVLKILEKQCFRTYSKLSFLMPFISKFEAEAAATNKLKKKKGAKRPRVEPPSEAADGCTACPSVLAPPTLEERENLLAERLKALELKEKEDSLRVAEIDARHYATEKHLLAQKEDLKEARSAHNKATSAMGLIKRICGECDRCPWFRRSCREHRASRSNCMPTALVPRNLEDSYRSIPEDWPQTSSLSWIDQGCGIQTTSDGCLHQPSRPEFGLERGSSCSLGHSHCGYGTTCSSASTSPLGCRNKGCGGVVNSLTGRGDSCEAGQCC